MDSLSFDCEWCGRGYEVTADQAGQAFQCRNCGGELQIPAAAGPPIGAPVPAAQRAAPPPRAAASDRQPCPFCGEDVARAARICRHCRTPLRGGATSSAGGVPQEVHTAAILSLILGLSSWFFCPLLGPFAIMTGNKARRLAARNGVETPATAKVGLVMGWIFTIIAIGVLLLFGLSIVLRLAA